MDEQVPDTQESYDFSDKTLLTAVIIVLAVIIAMACFHLYARWQALRRRDRQAPLIALYAANNPPAPTDHGLHPSVLNSLPVFLYSSEEGLRPPPECAVCLSEFEVNDVVRLLPKCAHSFHVDCIGMWLHSHSTCPLCRSTIEPVVNRTRRTTELDNNVCTTQTSSSLLSFKRLLSATASRKPLVAGTSNLAAGTSCGAGAGAAVLDSETGINQPIHAVYN